jgi:ubiquitin-conjugating enzyme E2 Q
MKLQLQLTMKPLASECRFLTFTHTYLDTDFFSESNPDAEVAQDPKYVACSTLSRAIGVPLCAISASRAFRVGTDDGPKSKRRKSPGKSLLSSEDTVSDGESISDIDFLFSDDEGSSRKTQDNGKGKMHVL